MKQVFLCVARGLSAPHTADLCHLLPPAGGLGDGRGAKPGGQSQGPGSTYRQLSGVIYSASTPRCLRTLVCTLLQQQRRRHAARPTSEWGFFFTPCRRRLMLT